MKQDFEMADKCSKNWRLESKSMGYKQIKPEKAWQYMELFDRIMEVSKQQAVTIDPSRRDHSFS